MQAWIRDIHEAWQPRMVEVTDPALKREAIQKGQIEPGQMLVQAMRPGLVSLQRMFDQEIMASASGLSAVMLMITEFSERFDEIKHRLMPQETEMFAWLLGMPIHQFSIVLEDNEDIHATDFRMSDLRHEIYQAIQRGSDEPISPTLRECIQGRLAMLRQQHCAVADPATEQRHHQQKSAALLPDAAVLDRLLRYETHAERSLYRCLTQLAQRRGLTVERLKVSLTQGDSPIESIHPTEALTEQYPLFGSHDSAKRTQIN